MFDLSLSAYFGGMPRLRPPANHAAAISADGPGGSLPAHGMHLPADERKDLREPDVRQEGFQDFRWSRSLEWRTIMTWLLVFYLSGAYAGGPATAQFRDQPACEAAGQKIKEYFKGRYEGHICVSLYSQS